MDEHDVKSLVLEHERDITKISMLVEHLAEAVTVTTQDVKKLLNGLTGQVLLVEKFDSLESNLKESFSRVHAKIEHIENAQNTEGCAVLKIMHKDVNTQTKLVDGLVEESKRQLPHWASKWILGFLVVQSVAFGTYTVSAIQDLELASSVISSKHNSDNGHVTNKLTEHGMFLNRNFGHIQGLKGGN